MLKKLYALMNRLNLKAKLALFVVILFQINSLLIIGFYGYFTANAFEGRIGALQSEMRQSNQTIIDGMTNLSDNASSMDGFLDVTARETGFNLSVYDTSGKLLYDYNYLDGLVGYETKDYVIIGGKIAYVLEFEYKFNVEAMRANGDFVPIRNFSFILMGVNFILLLFFFHKTVTQPIKMIQSKLKDFAPESPLISFTYHKKDEIGDLCHHFELMGQALDEANRLQDETLTAISHDLRTPLTAVIGYTERLMAKKELTQEKKANYYEIIYDKAQNILDLSERISETQKTKTDLKLVKQLSRDVFNQACREAISLTKSRDIKIAATDLIHEEIYLALDEAIFLRIIQNLCSNALSYAWPEKTPNQEPPQIILHTSVTDTLWTLAFEDNGVGIGPEQLEHVTKRFWRGENSRSRNTGGMGLGLALAKEMTEKMDGILKVYICPSGGLGISLSLPISK